MGQEPPVKRTIAFFDGQNLYRQAKDAFGYSYPNYSPLALASQVCRRNGFNLHEVRFYTGVPSHREDPFWSGFWSAKLLAMRHAGIAVFSRPLRYRKKTIRIRDGVEYSATVPTEKGIDVRIAIDVMRAVRQNLADVVLIFSQDQDFSEVADEVRSVAREQDRWIKIASAFPVSPTAPNNRGINKTDWIRIDRTLYDACIDRRDYRPSPKSSSGH
jgi:uncharacterized LabA/DUF88 family protein